MNFSLPIPERAGVAHQRHSPIRTISLFSGCGGMDLGFRGGFDFLGKNYRGLPFEFIWANELSPAACSTYRANLGNHVQCGDIWRFLDDVPRQADVVIGGFPCQDISINGKGSGIAGKRSGLYRAMVEVVRISRPKVFVAENVKALLMKHNSTSLQTIVRDFSALGYKVTWQLLNAADFGVPQTRERVFIVGIRDDEDEFRFPLGGQQWVSAKSAIGDLEQLEQEQLFSHIWSLAKQSPEQGNRRLVAERPGYTVRAECHGNIHFHYSQKRRISMREAARLQSFPDTFLFQSKLRETERQIGNAVPPLLAWNIAHSVASLF